MNNNKNKTYEFINHESVEQKLNELQNFNSRVNMSKKVNDEHENLSIDEQMTLTKIYDLLDKEKQLYCKNHNITIEEYDNNQELIKMNKLVNSIFDLVDKSDYQLEYNFDLNDSFIVSFNSDSNVVIDESVINKIHEHDYKIESISFDTTLNKLVVVLYKSLYY